MKMNEEIIMKREKVMFRGFCLLAMVSMVSVLLLAGVAGAQEYPLMNMIADNVIQKYQQATCEQLRQEGQGEVGP